MNNLTTSSIAAWYGISADFAHELLLNFVGDNYITTCESVIKLYDLYPGMRQQLEYAFSTNKRGADLVSYLGKIGVLSNEQSKGRYLDIGCAYGGFLSAFAKHGFEVEGIEYSSRLSILGRKNLQYSDIIGSIRTGDFLDEAVITSAQEYDLITCNDVIEHIADPEAALRKICSVLRPGGVAFLETVNRRSIVNVHTEIHSNLFGISLLDHHTSSAAFREYLATDTAFEISDFYNLEWYLNVARSAGVLADEAPQPERFYHFEVEIQNLWSKYHNWKHQGSKVLSFYSRFEIEKELFRYCSEMFTALSHAHNDHAFESFNRRWVDPIIRFIIKKPYRPDS